MKFPAVLLVILAGCAGSDPGAESGADPDGIASSSEAVSAAVGDWNSCYVLSQDFYPRCTDPSPGGVICIEQWGSFPAACQPVGSNGQSDCGGQLPATSVTFAPGKRCREIGYIGSDTQHTTCAYGTFDDYNGAFSAAEAASAYNCDETPPTASNVSYSYDATTGIATGHYTYSHELDAPEGRTTFQWYWNTRASDDGRYADSNAQAYLVPSWMTTLYLQFCVTPALDVLQDDGHHGGLSGAQACSGWQSVGTVPSGTTAPTAATDVHVSFAGSVAHLAYVYNLNGPETSSAARNRRLTPQDNGQTIQMCVTESSGTQTGVQACSAPTPVGHLLELYEDANRQGRNVNLPYEALGKGHCFENFKGYQFNDLLTTGIIHAPADQDAIVILYDDSHCSGATKVLTAPAGSDTAFSVGDTFNDRTSSVRVVWDDVPSAANVGIAFGVNDEKVGGTYQFLDQAGLVDSGSLLEFRRSASADGSNPVTIATGTTTRYLDRADNGNWLQFCVTPSNGYFTGTRVCSGWKLVGRLAELFTDVNDGGTNINVAYTVAYSGNCFRMNRYGIDDQLSSFELFAKLSVATTFTFYKDDLCDASGGSRNYRLPAGGSVAVGDLTTLSGWNDQISSMRVTWDDVVSASNVTLDVAGAFATVRYTYNDNDQIPESGSAYAFRVADDMWGTNAFTLPLGPTPGPSVGLAPAMEDKYLSGCVIPNNGINTGPQVCSPWTPVGRLVQLYQDNGFQGRVVSIAYTRSPPGTCFNLTDAGFNDAASSMKILSPIGRPVTLTQYQDVGCASYSFNTSCPAGTRCNLSSYVGWNDQVSSLSVSW